MENKEALGRASGRMNVLLIGVDQMRFDTPGYMGLSPCRTPNLDKLASDGCVFSRARTPCSLCSPARASLFTGDYAFTHGMGTNCDMYHSLSEELKYPERLLHTILIEQGYRCGYLGKWHVGKNKGPADYGFEGMNMPGYGDIIHDADFTAYLDKHGYSYSLTDCMYGNAGGETLLSGYWDGPGESTPAHYIANRTIDLLEDFAETYEKKERPFFLTCQFWGPHMPHLPSGEFYRTHDRNMIESWINSGDTWTGKPGIVRRMGTDFYQEAPNNRSEWAELIGCYYDVSSMIDFEIGRIINAVNELHLDESTLILFTSDHGDMTGSHGGLLDKGFMYEEAHRIPLLIKGPGIQGNKRCNELVMNMDIFPTVMNYLQISHPARDGKSFLAYISGKKHQAPPPFRDKLYMEFHGLRFLYSQRAMATDKGMKYIFTPGDQDELYDLNIDPGELRNLIDDPAYQEDKKTIRKQLLQEAVEYGDPLASCIAKLFGYWNMDDNQPNPTRL